MGTIFLAPADTSRPRWTALAPADLITHNRCMYMNHIGSPGAFLGSPCLAAQTRRVERVLVSLYDRRLRSIGITVAQLDLLATLLETEAESRAVDLARRMYMDPSTVSRNVSRLERLGLVKTRPGRTSREHNVSVTPRGRRRAARASALWAEGQREAMKLLGSEGVRALDLLVRRIDGSRREVS